MEAARGREIRREPRPRIRRTPPRHSKEAFKRALADALIKPNERLSSIERLEIYNRQYWFRLLDCLYDDYPGVRRILGETRFMEVAKAYLVRYPSRTYSLRDLGERLARFLYQLRRAPEWSAEGETLEIAREMARFEWAKIVAFDGASAPSFTKAHVLERDPSELKFTFPPYLSLLDLRYAVDQFSMQEEEGKTLRADASQAIGAAPKQRNATRQGELPRRERARLVVHRYENVVYFKRLEPEAFAILRALHRGQTLGQACKKGIAASRKKEIDWPETINAWFCHWANLGWLVPLEDSLIKNHHCQRDAEG